LLLGQDLGVAAVAAAAVAGIPTGRFTEPSRRERVHRTE
jgi:hypothetical protein